VASARRELLEPVDDGGEGSGDAPPGSCHGRTISGRLGASGFLGTAVARALHAAVGAAASPPPLWVNASTGTIYRHATDRPQGEDDGELGTGFSVDVARTWEAELFAGELPGTRRVALRMAIVLGDGPAARQLMTAARLGLGGPQYDG